MAQIWKVRLGGVPLGVTPVPRHVNAVGSITNGVAALTGIALMASNRRNAGYIVMISVAVVGAAIGAAKAYGGSTTP